MMFFLGVVFGACAGLLVAGLLGASKEQELAGELEQCLRLLPPGRARVLMNRRTKSYL